jgi:ABC-type phosphate transport system auxiliary subunit
VNELAQQSPPTARPTRRRRAAKRATSLFANGEPMVWLTGGALAVATVMIAVLLGLVLVEGLPTFWPKPVVEVELSGGRKLAGEVAAEDVSCRNRRCSMDFRPNNARRRSVSSRPRVACGGACCARATSSSAGRTSTG